MIATLEGLSNSFLHCAGFPSRCRFPVSSHNDPSHPLMINTSGGPTLGLLLFLLSCLQAIFTLFTPTDRIDRVSLLTLISQIRLAVCSIV